MRERFATPATDKLDLSDGDWLLVRRRLTHGEQSDAYARISETTPDGTIRANRLKLRMAMMLAYLLDWGGPAFAEQPIQGLDADSLEATLRALLPEDFDEIHEAIAAHEARQLTARLTAKNPPDGATTSPAISPSPEPVAGAMSGSAT